MKLPRRPLHLRALGPLPPGLLEWLAAELAARLPVHPRLAPPWPLHDAWRDERRGQYRSNQIVDALCEDADGGAVQLAVTAVDLCAPGRRFVFGEATLGGCCALVSLARLLPADDPAAAGEPARGRLLKESLHELGHVFALTHCTDACVMRASRHDAEIDLKPAAFCAACAAGLRTSGPPRRT